MSCPHGHPSNIDSWRNLELVWFTDGLGRRHLRHYCGFCGKCSNAVPRRDVRGTREIVSPLIDYVVCVVRGCRAPAVHRHHMAPYSVFGVEADDWPLVTLCPAHHEEWHARMNGYDRHRRVVVNG